MLRATVARLLALASTSVPSNFCSPIEMAFYFPRFQPLTHIADMGIPEIKDAVALLQGPDTTLKGYRQSKDDDTIFFEQTRWSTSAVRSGAMRETRETRGLRLKKREKGLMLLERGIDILEGLGGPCSANPLIRNMIRPLYAARFELINGSEHLPRPDYARHVHPQRLILNQSARLLFYNDGAAHGWDKSDVKQIDTALVILGHFVKAFCALHMKPFNEAAAQKMAAAAVKSPSASIKSGGIKSSSVKSTGGGSAAKSSSSSGYFNGKEWSITIPADPNNTTTTGEQALTLAMVMDRIDEALCLAVAAHKKHGANAPDLRWHEPKLLLLKALVTIPLTGNLAFAHKYIYQANNVVLAMKQRTNLLLDGLKDREFEVEFGLYNLLLAEASARMFNWSLTAGEADAAVIREFEHAAQFYATPFDTALNADGIMSEKTAHERVFEIEAYCCCLLSYATFLLNAPRPAATSIRDTPVFLPGQLFSFNALATVAASNSNMLYAEVGERVNFTIEDCRTRTGNSLMRALEVNRAIHPEDQKENPLAAWTLAGMACMYADTRDYLYAVGLFESAHKNFYTNYGPVSMENVLLQRLRYEFMAGVGSEQEAKTASHEVVGLLKQMDKLPTN